MKATIMKAAAMAETAMTGAANRGYWRSVLGLVLAGMLSGACSDSGRANQANDETDEASEDSGETTSHGSKSESQPSDAATSRESDASVASTVDTTSLDVDAALATSSAVSTVSSTTGSSAPITDDASVILEPDIQTLTVAQLCDQLAYLEGETVDVDLHDQLVQTEWRELDFVPVDADAAPVATDIATDAGPCTEAFAAYSVACRGHRLIVSAPSLVFGEGPEIGGETVGFGCWQRACETACMPPELADVASVRVRIEAPINGYFDEEAGVFRGLTRLNGVDFDAIGLLEITNRL